jgi:cation-transporting ATPase 13A2
VNCRSSKLKSALIIFFKKSFKHPVHNIEDGLEDGKLLRTLATCHSLSRFDGSLTGDPLDIKMFESTKWTFVDEPVAGSSKFEQVTPFVKKPKRTGSLMPDEEIAIVKQFTFSSSFLRMSVLCKALGSDCMEVYTKGAPEKIIELCKSHTG